MTPSDMLLKAAELIERDGWWDGHGDVDGVDERACAAMAINRVSGDSTSQIAGAARFAFKEFIGDRSIARWNDAQPNGAVVCAALRAAAKGE
jgi:hypothetical protein